jgi:hypothetical protein
MGQEKAGDRSGFGDRSRLKPLLQGSLALLPAR